MENTNKCPHCKSEDTFKLGTISNNGYADLVALLGGPRGERLAVVDTHVCLDCGTVFIPTSTLQALRNLKTRLKEG